MDDILVTPAQLHTPAVWLYAIGRYTTSGGSRLAGHCSRLQWKESAAKHTKQTDKQTDTLSGLVLTRHVFTGLIYKMIAYYVHHYNQRQFCTSCFSTCL